MMVWVALKLAFLIAKSDDLVLLFSETFPKEQQVAVFHLWILSIRCSVPDTEALHPQSSICMCDPFDAGNRRPSRSSLNEHER